MNTIRTILKFFKKNRILGISILVVLIAVTFLILKLIKRSSGTLSDPLKVSTIVQSVYGIGTVTATHSYQIKLGVVSTIYDLYVKEGDTVTKGTKLVNIDQIIYRAPFNGTITSLPYKIGENIFTQLPILSLVNLLDRYLVVSLEQQGALRVIKGQKVRMSFDSIRDQNYDGVVQAVYSYNSNFLARIDVSKLPDRILPDMTADVAITLLEKTEVLVVPVAALDHGEVWIKRGKSLAKKTHIKIGIVDKAFAEVLEGDVKVGDRVLFKGATAL